MNNLRSNKLRSFVVIAAIGLLSFLSAINAGAQTPVNLGTVIQPVGANLEPVPTGSAVLYNVTVRNTGAIAQSNVQAQIKFPGAALNKSIPGSVFNISVPGRWSIPAAGVGTGCTFAGGDPAVVSCTAGQLTGGASRSFTIQVITPTIINASPQQFTITAQAVSSAGAGAFNSSVVTNVTRLPDLDPEVEGPPSTIPGAVPPTVTTGTDLAYGVRVRNIGDGHASNVVSQITFPPATGFVRFDQSTFQSCTPTTGRSTLPDELLCSSPAGIPAGGEASVRVVARPNPLAADGTALILSVNADPNHILRERNETNNTSFSIRTLRASADLEVSGTISITNPLLNIVASIGATFLPPTAGAPENFQLIVANLRIRNLGPSQSPATTVRIPDWPNAIIGDPSFLLCPAGTSWDLDKKTCFEGAPRYHFNSAPVPALGPGAAVNIALVAGTFFKLGVNIVEFGTATVDPNRLVNDRNLQNNAFSLKP